MLTVALVLVAVFLALLAVVYCYAMFTGRGLMNRLCAYNGYSAAVACLLDVLAALFGRSNC